MASSFRPELGPPPPRKPDTSGVSAPNVPTLGTIEATLAADVSWASNFLATQKTIDQIAGSTETVRTNIATALRAKIEGFLPIGPHTKPQDIALIQALLRLEQPDNKPDITGQYSPELTTRLQAVRTMRTLDTVAQVADLRTMLDTAVATVTRRALMALDRPEGISLHVDALYSETLAVLKDTDAALPPNHPLKGSVPILVANFLTPPEAGKLLLRTALHEAFSGVNSTNPISLEQKRERFDAAAHLVHATLGMLIDTAKTQDPAARARMQAIADGLKNDPTTRALTDRFPDVFTFLLSSPPESLAALDKNTTLAAVDTLFTGSREDCLTLIDTANTDTITPEIKAATLRTIQHGARFLRTIATDQNTTLLLKDCSKLSLAQGNVFGDTLSLLGPESGLSDGDRGNLMRLALSGVELFSGQNINEVQAEAYFNNLLRTIVTLTQKVPRDRLERVLTGIFTAIFGSQPASSQSPSASDGFSVSKALSLVGDTGELVSFAWDNIGLVAKSAVSYVSQDDAFATTQDIVKYLLDNRALENNLEYASGALVSRAKRLFATDLVPHITAIRDSLATSLPRNLAPLATVNTTSVVGSFEGELASTVIERVGAHIASKLRSGMAETGGNITRAELIGVALGAARDFTTQNSTRALECLRAAGIHIPPTKEWEALQLITRLIEHPRMTHMVERIMANAAKRIGNASPESGEVRTMLADLATQSGINTLFSSEVRQEAISISVDTLYAELATRPELANTLLAALGVQSIGTLSAANIQRIGTLLVRSVPRPAMVRFLGVYTASPPPIGTPQLVEAGAQLFASIPPHKRSDLITELVQTGLIGKALATKAGDQNKKAPNTKPTLWTANTLTRAIDTVYLLRQSTPNAEVFARLSADALGWVSPLLGKALPLVLQDIPQDRLKSVLTSADAVEFINAASRGSLDMSHPKTQERLMRITTRLYEAIPPDRLAACLDALVQSWLLAPIHIKKPHATSKPNAAPITPQTINHIVSVAYHTLSGFSGTGGQEAFAERFAAMARQSFPGQSVDQMLNIRFLGGDLGANLYALLRSTPRATLERLLVENITDVQTVISAQSEPAARSEALDRLGSALALAVDASTLRTTLQQGRKLSAVEAASVDALESLQKGVRSIPDFPNLLTQARTVTAGLSARPPRVSSEFPQFSARLFEVIGMVMEQAPAVFSALTNASEGSASSSNKLAQIGVISTFIRHNFGFVLSNLLSCVFDTEKAVATYFKDTSNQTAFVATCQDLAQKYVAQG